MQLLCILLLRSGLKNPVKELKNEEDLSRLTEENEMLILQFGADYCAPCGAIRNKLSDFLDLQREVSGIYIPIEKFPALSASLGVFSVPTLILYVKGSMSLRESGYFSLSDFLFKTRRYIDLLK